MSKKHTFSGFSKLNREQRVQYLQDHSFLTEDQGAVLETFCPSGETHRLLFDSMVENYLTNFPVPMGVVPNMLINGDIYAVPFAIEESSVVAAAAKAAKFWSTRGGFRAEVQAMTKKGQVHFIWNGDASVLANRFEDISIQLLHATSHLTAKMRHRGGGISGIELIDKSRELDGYFILDFSFETADSMGANFINSCLEAVAAALTKLPELNKNGHQAEVILSILSNFTPDCKVKCWVECPVQELAGWNEEFSGSEFARKFHLATEMARIEVSRAVTHNKGIFNGIDAVLLASGNDCRATAASAHAWAARDGNYRSLTTLQLTDQLFRYELELPLAIGTVGGITQIHPVVKNNLEMLNNPDARKLMMIAAAAGLANNFAAVASLITTGIQQGHMRMHLQNILQQLQASSFERERVLRHFKETTISYAGIESYLNELRQK